MSNSITPPARPTISAFVVCCNEEKHIARCLRSISWCDEVIVVDSGSTDQTIVIAKGLGARVIQNSWTGYVEQKTFGLAQCTGDWVINIDADEEVSPELKQQILEVIRSPSKLVGYELSRVVFYLGRWWRRGGWYPEYRLRLMRRINARWGGDNPHEHAIVDGETGQLDGELRHYTFEDISDHIRSLNGHSSIAAATLYRKGARFSLFACLTRPWARFAKFYLLRGGYREGLAGFIVAVLESVYVFLKYIKLWELSSAPPQKN